MSEITPEELSAMAGIVLSLGFSYIPGVRDRFGGLEPVHKRLVMLGLLLACALGVFSLSCLQSGMLPAVSCSRAGAWELGRIFVSALIANQAAFSVSPHLTPPIPHFDELSASSSLRRKGGDGFEGESHGT